MALLDAMPNTRQLVTSLGCVLGCSLGLWSLLPAFAQAAAKPAAAELAAGTVPARPGLRVLIDVSGSMVQNDPENLRVAGLRLLTGLLSPDIDAGVWLFGAKPEGLLKAAPVTEAWKEKARLLASRIHSRAAFTNIEQALRAAAADWLKQAPAGPRDVLLLTDGVVDVAKDPSLSAASRRRIESELIPALTEAKVAVHSIALSPAADRELLQLLANATGGHTIAVSEAAALDRAFLKLLEGSHPRDGLPMEGKELAVDASVRELTLLSFHRQGEPRLTLTTPEGETLEPPKLPEGVRWLREAGYDLVTVTAPTPGTWFMNGPTDPDNRALVVSDLGLNLDELPHELRAGNDLDIAATLTEHGEPIAHQAFLDLVEVAVGLDQGEDRLQSLPLQRLADSARFEGELSTLDLDGDLELKLEVRGKTFARERRSRIRVLPQPIRVELGGLASDDPEFLVYVEPTGDAPAQLEVKASWQSDDGAPQQQVVKAEAGQTIIKLPKHGPEVLELKLLARGVDAAGLAFEQRLGPYWLEAFAQPEANPETPTGHTGVRWLRVAWQVGAANIFAILLASGSVFWWQRRTRAEQSRFETRLAHA